MYFLSGDKVWDFDFDLMSGVLDTLDRQLASLDEAAKGCPDPDGFGIFDEAEYLAGIGFVVCQRYLSATASWSGIPKRQALDLPPLLPSGRPVAALVIVPFVSWALQSSARAMASFFRFVPSVRSTTSPDLGCPDEAAGLRHPAPR